MGEELNVSILHYRPPTHTGGGQLTAGKILSLPPISVGINSLAKNKMPAN